MSKATIVTHSGIMFDMLETTLDMITIEDIAHASSQANRYTGHCHYPYPVSQHSRLGSYLVPKHLALRFLLHDASEAYLGDMNWPLKNFTPAGKEYRKVETPLQRLIYKKFGIFGEDPEIIHRIDNEMLYAERRALLPRIPWTWGDETEADVKIVETSFRENKRLFLERFYELYNHV
jgi:hypothetical protein